MKIALITPWKNAWVPHIWDAVNRRGHLFCCAPSSEDPRVLTSDVVIHGWLQGAPVPGARNIYFLRRYELFSQDLSQFPWKQVDALICVNDWIADFVRQHLERVPVHVVYNAVDPAKWKYADREAGPLIGMACHVHWKKNLPLALQILMKLPAGYELHIAGALQDPCTAEYLNHLGKWSRRRLYLYGHVDDMDNWWEQMHFCLSTSISEGNPNNVIEAMAKGIKPVVHHWPGAERQFPPECRFDVIDGAVEIIRDRNYCSADYRAWVEEYFSLANIERVLDIALGEDHVPEHEPSGLSAAEDVR